MYPMEAISHHRLSIPHQDILVMYLMEATMEAIGHHRLSIPHQDIMVMYPMEATCQHHLATGHEGQQLQWRLSEVNSRAR